MQKTYRFVEDIPNECFNKNVQHAVTAPRERDEKPNSKFLAETIKMLASRSYGYQNMDYSHHTAKNFFNEEKTHGAIKTKFFIGWIKSMIGLFEVGLAKAEIEHREAIIVGFVILQFAKLRMLELYYNFFERF